MAAAANLDREDGAGTDAGTGADADTDRTPLASCAACKAVSTGAILGASAYLFYSARRSAHARFLNTAGAG